MNPLLLDALQNPTTITEELNKLNIADLDQNSARISPLRQTGSPMSVSIGPSAVEGFSPRPFKISPRVKSTKRYKIKSFQSPITLQDQSLEQPVPDDNLPEHMREQQLDGPVKSKWAMRYKYDTDQAIVDKLGYVKKVFDKRSTKGSFEINIHTNAGNWMTDKKW